MAAPRGEIEFGYQLAVLGQTIGTVLGSIDLTDYELTSFRLSKPRFIQHYEENTLQAAEACTCLGDALRERGDEVGAMAEYVLSCHISILE